MGNIALSGVAAIEKCTRVLSAQRCVRRSLLYPEKQIVSAPANEPEPKQISSPRAPLLGTDISTRTSNGAAVQGVW